MAEVQYSHGFFSIEQATSFGFCLCAKADNPEELVRITHSVFGGLPENLPEDAEYMGVIEMDLFGKNHYHLMGWDMCRACATKKIVPCVKTEPRKKRRKE